ncbi:hypothetical protein QEH52_19460 [Coraliomargarita sp. SDUM461003]|uniref:Lipoprotein n=1 Tax=Thalassobacterium maritimum TaxID=3041265 RepID=A0ABU1B296_9BACT|nr:hypothetical protein [Coraliomargarita sp. SDUM461003]MDQ8209705.1 hypothetical protein [Coraliomargarita sp. SDUM461003]
MKTTLIAIISFIVGCAATGLFVREGMDFLDQEQIVNFQHAELLKGTLVANGQDDKVIMLIRNYIEGGICRDASIQTIYSEEKHRKRISEEIQRFYFALDEQPPDHVSKWLKDGTLTYEKVEDAFSVSRFTQGQNESEIYGTQKYRNISNVGWKEVAATAYLYDAENNLVEKKEIELNGVVNPQDDAIFEFVFQKPKPGQESFFLGYEIDVTIKGTRADQDAVGNG